MREFLLTLKGMWRRVQAQKVHQGRYAAQSYDGLVVMLIGVRINNIWKVHRWLPQYLLMFPMLREVYKLGDEVGFLDSRVWLARTSLMVQYWRSMEDLLAYARSTDGLHVPAWRRFNQVIGNSEDLGVFHEAYVTHPAEMHMIYRNMPLTGLASVTEHVPMKGNYASKLKPELKPKKYHEYDPVQPPIVSAEKQSA